MKGWAGLATWLFRIPGNNRAERVGRDSHMAVQDIWHRRAGGRAGLATWLSRIPGTNREMGWAVIATWLFRIPGTNRAEGVGRHSHMAVQNTWSQQS